MTLISKEENCRPSIPNIFSGPGPLVVELEKYTTPGTEEVKDLVDPVWLEKQRKQVHAYTFLEKAVSEMKDRATQRDTTTATVGGKGERSMIATVKAFNALTGHNLSEEEGWEFMILLKLVRGRQGAFRADDYVDASAYCGLLGECASTSR